MLTRRSMILAGTAGLASAGFLSADTLGPDGVWTGMLDLGSTRLRLRFEFAGSGAVTFYSVDQDNQAIAGKVRIEGDRIRVELKTIGATYVGRMTDGARIDGTWKQNIHLPLRLLPGEGGYAEPVEPLTQAALTALLRRCEAPAISAIAQRRGHASLAWVAGRRSIGASARVTPSDVWHLGSLTKSMTATLVARLVDAGEISWDLSVATALGNVAPGMNPAYRAATFRHLLSHRAGLPSDLSGVQLTMFAFGDSFEIRGQRRRYARLALSMKPVGSLESSYLYSNNGYVVAGAMLEATLGASWEDLMRRYVFEPLGLATAGFGPPDAGAIGELRQPVGHASDLDARLVSLVGGSGLRPLRPGFGETVDNPRVLGPAATVHMSLPDLLTYLAAHRDGSAYLSTGSWKTLHTAPFGGDYALGWVVRPDGSLWHNGSNTFWYAEALFHRERGIAAAAACNEARSGATLALGTTLLRATAAV